MSLDERVTSSDIAAWAERRVNLSSEAARAYREQGERLRVKLERYVDNRRDFDLVKMLNSGSVAKGTALRTTSDLDVGVYVRRTAAPTATRDLVSWLANQLRDAYGDLIAASQITADDASVRVAFLGTGVDVECVPILYDGAADNYGDLLLRTGKRVRTSISKHLEFFRERKARCPGKFAQWVRLLRFWRNQRAEENRMPLSGFAVELLACHLLDRGLDPGDYPSAMQAFFTYIVRTGLSEPVVFTDNYPARNVIDDGRPIRIVDPVSETNNVTDGASAADLAVLIDVAADGLDDVTIARTATTKEDAVEAWREVFGPEFIL